jgi:hypothetical protein
MTDSETEVDVVEEPGPSGGSFGCRHNCYFESATFCDICGPSRVNESDMSYEDDCEFSKDQDEIAFS